DAIKRPSRREPFHPARGAPDPPRRERRRTHGSKVHPRTGGVREALHRFAATEELLRESLFGETKRAEAILGDVGEEPVAFAVFYHSFSTYLGWHCLHLEDLYVRPDRRGAGLGRIMLSYLARVAKDRKCALMEW